jgi:FkbM family methyltransferase
MSNHKIVTSIKLNHLGPYLLRRAVLRVLPAFPRRRKVRIFGQRVELDLADLEQKYLAADCVREPENYFVYSALSAAGMVDTFIDIGANCGHVAASLVYRYKSLVLIEPNPNLANLLKAVFSKLDNVTIKETAITSEELEGTIELRVPKSSSGLATLSKTHLHELRKDVQSHSVTASTLRHVLSDSDLRSCYIKIDVEGYEQQIIESSVKLLREFRPIVGFEALTKEAAKTCGALFDNYKFYCARFDFLDSSGALTKSIVSSVRASLRGSGHLVVLNLASLETLELDNFSQIFSVPAERSLEFENSIEAYSRSQAEFDLRSLRTWKRKSAID